MKRFLEIVIGVCIIAGICYWINTFRDDGIQDQAPEIIRPVRTIVLSSGQRTFTRSYFGTVQGSKRADLSFRVAGTLNRILVDKGASVKKGTLLATLDPRDYNTRVAQAKSSLAQAQAQYRNAQADFKRYENLYKQRAIAKSQYDSYKTQLDVSASAVDTAQAQVKSVQDALKDTELRAPFAGVIADRAVENYQDVNAKQTIFSLQDINSLEVVFNIPDNDVLMSPFPDSKSITEVLKAGNRYLKLNARFEAMPDRTFPLILKEFAAQANTSTNTYPVTAIMPPQKGVGILPGMSVTVEAFYEETEEEIDPNKFFVPVTAVMNENNNNYVWQFVNNSAHKVQIKTGSLVNNGFVEIDSDDLKDGDLIITAGVYFLHEGQHIRLMEE